MGGCANSPAVKRPVNVDSAVVKKYLMMMALDHPLNINKRYEHVQRLNMHELVGTGLRQTCSYDCLLTREEMLKQRLEYWETRTHGKKPCWDVLREAVESNANDQQALKKLRAAGLQPLNNSLQMVLDQTMVKYQVPVFCLNEARSYSQRTAALSNLKHSYVTMAINVKIRSTRSPGDTTLSINTSDPVSSLKQMYRQSASLSPTAKIRLMYSGREMVDNMPVGSYRLNEGTTIQAMIVDA